MSPYMLSLLTSIAIFAILSLSLSLLIGHMGIFSMAHAALFGVGAYTYAFLSVKQDWSPLAATAAAIVLAAAAGAVMAVPALRVSGDYFIVASFALQIVASSVFSNWTSVTGGTGGIPGIVRPVFGPIDLFQDQPFLVYSFIVLLIVAALGFWLVRSPFGRMMHTIRDDEVVAATMGKPVRGTKILVTVLAGAFAGLAGVVYGQYLMYISPGSFEVATSVSIITMVVVGGMTSILGSIIGAAIITVIPPLLQEIRLAESVAGPLEQAFFGLLLVVLMFTRPQGLLADKPHRRPRSAGTQAAAQEASHVA
ncbi:branched-chain amino acid ABC transporter permease [Kribbia dieselivorans]|uniref:branched-chain amino acid ABC transporter permease n=1 Tax=Kribbia dieselivorans TaxID=331526 RepID=UPI000839A859|nr:branched-chain amino acid ABC transporter permease [Kribbia dieselivorans]